MEKLFINNVTIFEEQVALLLRTLAKYNTGARCAFLRLPTRSSHT